MCRRREGRGREGTGRDGTGREGREGGRGREREGREGKEGRKGGGEESQEREEREPEKARKSGRQGEGARKGARQGARQVDRQGSRQGYRGRERWWIQWCIYWHAGVKSSYLHSMMTVKVASPVGFLLLVSFHFANVGGFSVQTLIRPNVHTLHIHTSGRQHNRRSALSPMMQVGWSRPGQLGPTAAQLAKKKKQFGLGGLKKLPRVFPADELINRAVNQALSHKEDTTVKNQRQRARKFAAEQLAILSKELTKPTGEMLEGYERILKNLSPFEKVAGEELQRSELLSCHAGCRGSDRQVTRAGGVWIAPRHLEVTAGAEKGHHGGLQGRDQGRQGSRFPEAHAGGGGRGDR
eukprot:766700-Hanusia_phi.AAC.1